MNTRGGRGASVRYRPERAKPLTDEFGTVACADDVCVVPDVEPSGQASDKSAEGPTRELSVG